MNNTTNIPQQEISDHLCECGCGGYTLIARYTDRRFRIIRGEPYPYIHDHAGRRPLAERFWEKVDKVNFAPCWIWQGANGGESGHGRFQVGGQTKKAHRIVWEMTYGEIPKGMCVCHNCPDGDNSACVRPSHLYLGTVKDNNDDKIRKGRFIPNIGEENGSAKLTESQVMEIRSLYAGGGYSYVALAELKHVTPGAIRHIIKRRTWKHIP